MQWLFEDMKREYSDQSEDNIQKMLGDPDWLEKKEQSVQRTLEKSQRLAHGNLEELEVCFWQAAQKMIMHPYCYIFSRASECASLHTGCGVGKETCTGRRSSPVRIHAP